MRNMTMRRSRIALIIATAATAAVMTASVMPPVQAAAARTGWRLAFRHAYGPVSYSSALFHVAAPDAGDAWAVGGSGNGDAFSGFPIAVHYRNRTWRRTPLPRGLTGMLIAVSADSRSDAWAVGIDGYLLHWRDGRWHVARRWPEPTSLPREFTGVTALSPGNVWVFGSGGFTAGFGTWHLAGGKWTRVTGAAADITFASALSRTDIWAIGGKNAPQDSIVHLSHGRWSYVTSKVLAGHQFAGIVATRPGQVWAAASVGGGPVGTELVHLSHGRWTSVRLPGHYVTESIASDGAGGLWLAAFPFGHPAVLLHRSAAGRLTRYVIGNTAGLALIPRGTSMWAVGSTRLKSRNAAAIWQYGRT
jgi:hypothetical protein